MFWCRAGELRRRSRSCQSVGRQAGDQASDRAAAILRAAVADALLTPTARQGLPETAGLITDVLRHADRKGLYLAMRSIMLGRPDLTHLPPRITAPTLLVAGGDDPMWTAASAGAAAAQLPHGQAATIASTRHMPALEAPDQIISLITGLWAATASSDAAH